MTRRPASLTAQVAAGAAILLMLSGCGGSPSNAPSNAAATSSTATSSSAVASSPTLAATSPEPSAVATAPSPSADASAPAVTASHADPGLEALLPAEISGTSMQRSSATLEALIAAGADRKAIDTFLQGIGKAESDGTYAAAFDPANVLGGGIFAFKIAGVDAGVLLPAILAVEQSDLGPGATTHQANVGGKDVTVVSVGTGVNDTEWVYGADDVVFVIHAADEAHAAAFLQALS